MGSRLIFLHFVRLEAGVTDLSSGSHDQMCACRKAEGDLIPKLIAEVPRNSVCESLVNPY